MTVFPLSLTPAAMSVASGITPVAPRGPMKDYSDHYVEIVAWTLLAIAVVVGLMAWGWIGRKRRQGSICRPAAVPEDLYATEPLAASEGMYVATVLGEDRLDRVAAHQLGVRSTARLEVHSGANAGVVVLRPGVDNLFVPASDVRRCGTTAGMAGKFVEPNGLVAFTWDLGGTEVSTAFRPRDPQDRRALLDALQTVIDTTAGLTGAAQEDAR